MAKRKPHGMVFVSYAHADRARVEPLVNALAAQFNVWWDKEIELGETWRRTLTEKLDSARCVVVVWTTESVGRDFIWSELDRVKDRGIVVPVKLDQNARIPLEFDQMLHLDLASWTGRNTRVLKKLFDRIRKQLARPAAATRYTPTLSSGAWAVNRSLQATEKLRQLSDEVRTIGGILIPGAGPVEDLLGTLVEVHRTYASVSEAISRFVAPAVRNGRIDVKRYLSMERGELTTQIANNRGHCTRIVEYYARVGGLRDWLEPRLEPDKLKVLDETFGQLGNADGDLFEHLVGIGDVLTGEASAIVGLLVSGQQGVARERILAGRKKLLPLERGLSEAMRTLQRVESSLGYVPRIEKGRQTPR